MNWHFNLLGDSSDIVILLVELVLFIVVLAGWWKTFEKAGEPGWAAIIPIFDLYILCKIAGRSGWWVLLFFIPIANLVALILINLDVARNFGKSAGFGIGLALLGFIFYPILGFGDAQYVGAQQQRGFPVQPAYGAPPPPPPRM